MRRLKSLMVLAVGFSILLLFSSASYAGKASSGKRPLVDAAWLAQNRAHAVLVDLRSKEAYLEGHIPGAISVPVDGLQSKPDDILLPVPRLNRILGESGLDLGKDVVLYGEGKEMAYLGYWMFDYLGMKRLHVLNGGIEAWKGDLSTSVAKLPPSVFRAKPDPRKYATTRYVRASLIRPNVIILDARTPGEYKGTDVRSLRGGHIPGAININFERNYEPGSTILKPVSELSKIYGKLDKRKEVIVYCQTGTRAANTYFVLKELGFPKVRDYDASWIVWGTRLDLPAADVSYFNFVPEMKAIKKLEKGEQKK